MIASFATDSAAAATAGPGRLVMIKSLLILLEKKNTH